MSRDNVSFGRSTQNGVRQRTCVKAGSSCDSPTNCSSARVRGSRKWRELPWERRLFERSPRKITGPYFLYCALVFWHFHARWWFIALAAVVGAGSLAATIIERGKPWHRDQS
jgi:hypothetical protein